MNIDQYKKQKIERTLEQSQKHERLMCPQCRKAAKNCICEALAPFDPKIKVVILMHPMEAKKERTGTGRMAHLSLLHSEIIVGINFTHNTRVNELINDSSRFSTVLYPGDNALNITDSEFNYTHTKGKELVVFIIDGTWPCAKKMMTLSTNLHTITRVCFTPRKRSQFSIKQQPHELCVSTIEAIYIFLDDIQNQAGVELFGNQHQTLLDMLQVIVDFQISCAINPAITSYRKKAYKPNKDKKPSKKWESRSIFFRD